MSRPLTQLVYTRVQEGRGSPRLVTLHDYKQYARDVQHYALASDQDARIVGLESYKGVFSGTEIIGYTWFVGPETRPSPVFFGDALAEIERFLWDEIDRQGSDRAELPFLIGVGQGAIMSLAAAAAVPDLISGVIAVDASFPSVPGWEPPLAPLDGLPLLLIADPEAPVASGVLRGESLADTFRAWGGAVQLEWLAHPKQTVPEALMSRWLTARHPRFYEETPYEATEPGPSGNV